ncbi:MAG: glycoside hydrolase family 3 N-terminal domain-containing protein [Rhodomicrobiaceae bacterium]
MRRFLCAALFAGLIFASAFGLAQRAYSQAEWPDVPVITEEAPPPDTPVPRSTPSGWPGTGQPSPFTPAPASSAARSAPETNAAAAQGTGSSDSPERRAARTSPPVVPPLPERLNGKARASSDGADASETEAVARTTPAAEAPEPAVTASTQRSTGDAEADASTSDTDATSTITADAGAPEDAVSSEAADDANGPAGPQSSSNAAPVAQGQTDSAQSAETGVSAVESTAVEATDPAPKAENAAQPSGGGAVASRQSGAEPDATAAPEAEPAQDATADAASLKTADEAVVTEEIQPDIVPATASIADAPEAAPPGKAATASHTEPDRVTPPSAATAAKAEATETGPADQAQALRTAPASGDDSADASRIAPGAATEPAKPSTQSAKAGDGLDEIIGQMILVAFDGIDPKQEGPRRTRAQAESGRIGGVLFTGRNVQSVRQLTDLAHSFKNATSEHPPFIAVTHEGGAGQPLSAEKGFSAYPSAGALGSANDPLNAFTVYQRMAEKLSAFGFNVNLGPTIDIQPTTDTGISPDESHSYGSTPKHVVAFAKAFRLAHQQHGILTVLKHFPAQTPDKSDDVPAESAEIPDPLEAFRQMIASENADLIMTGHLADPRFSDEPELPASLSVKAVKERLRGDLKFEGVVLSGDLASSELAGKFSLKDRVVRAINAGTDVLLFAGDAPDADMPGKIAEIIRKAVAGGELERGRLEASYKRIIRLKQSLGHAAQAVAATEGNSAN